MHLAGSAQRTVQPPLQVWGEGLFWRQRDAAATPQARGAGGGTGAAASDEGKPPRDWLFEIPGSPGQVLQPLALRPCSQVRGLLPRLVLRRGLLGGPHTPQTTLMLFPPKQPNARHQFQALLETRKSMPTEREARPATGKVGGLSAGSDYWLEGLAGKQGSGLAGVSCHWPSWQGTDILISGSRARRRGWSTGRGPPAPCLQAQLLRRPPPQLLPEPQHGAGTGQAPSCQALSAAAESLLLMSRAGFFTSLSLRLCFFVYKTVVGVGSFLGTRRSPGIAVWPASPAPGLPGQDGVMPSPSHLGVLPSQHSRCPRGAAAWGLQADAALLKPAQLSRWPRSTEMPTSPAADPANTVLTLHPCPLPRAPGSRPWAPDRWAGLEKNGRQKEGGTEAPGWLPNPGGLGSPPVASPLGTAASPPSQGATLPRALSLQSANGRVRAALGVLTGSRAFPHHPSCTHMV